MSKFDYQKELKESGADGLFKASALIGSCYFMGSSKPTLSPTLKNFAIIAGIIAVADVTYDYFKQKNGHLGFK